MLHHSVECTEYVTSLCDGSLCYLQDGSRKAYGNTDKGNNATGGKTTTKPGVGWVRMCERYPRRSGVRGQRKRTKHMENRKITLAMILMLAGPEKKM